MRQNVKPTQDPVPSSNIKDLFFNSGLLDIWATSLEPKYIDRFGNCHLTAAGMEWLFKELVETFKVDMNIAIVAAGYITIDSFQQGADLPNNELTQRNHILRDETTGEYYRWDGDLPKQVPVGSTPQSTGGIGKGAWVSVGDASLRSSRIFTQRPAGVSLTDIVSVKDYGAKGDGVTDDTDAIDLARADSKIIFFPYTEKGYVYKKEIDLVEETWIGEGVGRRWGNTAPTILVGGFSADFAINSKTKTNTLHNLLIRPVSWGADGFLGGGLNVDAIINTRDCGIFGFKTNNLHISSTGTNESWLSTFENTWFGYSGEHGILLKNSANIPSFINCSSNWSGCTEFMKAPTEVGEWDGLHVYATKVAASGVTAPENMILIGGDWSYNSRYGINIQSGHGGTIRPGYLEHNLKNGVFLGGTAKGYDITLGHVGQSLETDLESPYTTTLAGNYITMPNKVKLNGIDRGIGHNFGDNSTDIPVRALDSEATTHKMLTASWSGVFGSIMKLMDKAGNMIFKSKSDDSRTMSIKLDGVRLESAQPIIHRLVTRAALEFTTLPEPSVEYQNSFVMQTSDRTLYYCYYSPTGFVWKKMW